MRLQMDTESSDPDDFDTDEGDIDDEDELLLNDDDDDDEEQQSTSNGNDNNTGDDLRGLVGLQNLGNTCYMNGALQALSNCQQLTRFVLDCPGFVKNTGLSRCYSELINEIWNSKNAQYAVPTSIIRNIECIYPAFRGCTQQDTQEFLRCFLEQLHDELKQPLFKKRSLGKLPQVDSSKTPDSLSSSSSQSVSPSLGANDDAESNRESANSQDANHSSDSQHQQQHHHNHQRSIISDTFEFRISSSIVCSSCNNISTTKETFKDLSVPIPSRDHPYYQQTLDNNTDNNANSTGESNQKATKSKSKDAASSSSSSTLANSNTHSDSSIAENLKSSSESLSSLSSEEKRPSHDRDMNVDGEASSGSNYLALNTTSYLDSIPLARWFLNWFSQLGNWFWGPQVTLYDCLSVFFGADPLEGDNEYSCEVCTKKNRGIKYLKILELPEVLCIHFKRYESVGSAKITTHVSFPLTGLDLSPFMSPDSRPQCTTYNLIACICHHGSALLTGHYTTYALNCYDDQWYEFDDQYVTCVSSYQVENSEAYILFYQKSTMDDTTDRQRVKASKLLKRSLRQEEGSNAKKYFISKQWVNKFNTFVEPGPITNHDFLCEHAKVPMSNYVSVHDLCHPISETVWNYLVKLHGGGPVCRELDTCDICE